VPGGAAAQGFGGLSRRMIRLPLSSAATKNAAITTASGLRVAERSIPTLPTPRSPCGDTTRPPPRV
jgi:hypothetical protein